MGTYIYVAASKLGGRGVFAGQALCTGVEVERSPVVRGAAQELSGSFHDYAFCDDAHRGESLLLLGYGGLYNHASEPNLRYQPGDDETMVFTATRDIAAGDELTVDYGAAWWKSRGRLPNALLGNAVSPSSIGPGSPESSAPTRAFKAPASPRVSFIVPTRNEDPEVLRCTIEGLLATSQGVEREILVIDDASELSVHFDHPEVQVLRNPEALGVSRARRLGGERARGELLFWLDAHMRFDPDWLQPMLDQAGSGALLCTPYISYDLATTYAWGADFSWQEARDRGNARTPGLGYRLRTREPRAGAVEVPLVIGACYAMERRSYERLGGFSPLFRVYGNDEQDISARAWLAGCGVRCVTRSRVGHLSRSDQPYSVSWDHIELNRLLTVLTIFEKPTIDLLEPFFEPLPARVARWRDATALAEWRAEVESRRVLSDADFFGRFVRDAPIRFAGGVRAKRGRIPPHRAQQQLWQEADAALRANEVVEAPGVGAFARCGQEPEAKQAAERLPGLVAARSVSLRASPALGAAGRAVEIRGTRVGIHAKEPALLDLLLPMLPAGSKALASSDVDLLYSVRRTAAARGRGAKPGFALDASEVCVQCSEDPLVIREAFARALGNDLAIKATNACFVPACSVGWRGRALVVLGAEAARPALAAELLRAGASCYSGDFAIFDAEGRVHPFATPLRLASQDDAGPRCWGLGAVAAAVGVEPLPVGLLAVAEPRPGARWRARPLSTADALMALFERVRLGSERRGDAFEMLSLVARKTSARIAGRGAAAPTARALLRHLDRVLDSQPSPRIGDS